MEQPARCDSRRGANSRTIRELGLMTTPRLRTSARESRFCIRSPRPVWKASQRSKSTRSDHIMRDSAPYLNYLLNSKEVLPVDGYCGNVLVRQDMTLARRYQ